MKILRASLALAVLASAAGLATAVGPAAGAFPNAIPVEALLAPPDFIDPRLSPAGKHLAFLTELGTGKQGIALMDLATGKVDALVGLKTHDVSYFFWKSDDLIVFGVDSSIWGWETICTVSVGTREVKTISPSTSQNDRFAVRKNYVALENSLLRSADKIVVRGVVVTDKNDYVHQTIDIHTGEIATVADDHPRMSTTWIAPAKDGSILARMTKGDGRSVIEVRPDDGADFAKVASLSWTDPNWVLWGLSGSEDSLYTTVEDQGTRTSFHAMSLATGDIGPSLVEVEEGAILSLIHSGDFQTLQGVVIEDQKSRHHWFDPARARIQAQIDASLKGTFNSVVSSTRDEKVMLLFATSDTEPGTYYVLDRRIPRLMPLGDPRSKINRELLCPMEPIRFDARDGLRLHGYLTRPKGRDGRPAPLVVIPHDDPFDTRDSWNYSAKVQFFASRGYAVLQVNFRGSSGYGSAFERAGWQEVGGKMQDDIADGVAWAVREGVADPARVAIFGEDYGGYAALMGVVNHPGLYYCAINLSGVLDLNAEVGYAWWRTRHSRDYLETRFGKGKEILKLRSPMNLVEKLNVPTLHLYYGGDGNHTKESWKKFSDRLKKAKAPFESLVVDDFKPYGKARDVRIALFKRMEEFLLKHMPPDE